MKSILSLLLVLTPLCALLGQNPPDTLYANERQVLSLFFKSPIEKAVTGASNYAFTFNRETPEPLGLLQATEGPKSNLLVLTEDGGIYSFIIAYRDSLTAFTRFVDSTRGLQEGTLSAPLVKDTLTLPPAIEKICRGMLRDKRPLKKGPKHMGIRLSRSQGFYHNQLVYIAYEIENHTGIDYEIKDLSLLKVLGTGTRKASFQQRRLPPLYSYPRPGIVSQGTRLRFVVAYKKFTLGPNESLTVRIDEKNGSRNFEF
jgi:hypothetical protein